MKKRAITPSIRRCVAVVLAGGRGSRLKGLTNWRVKPAVPFGGQFRIIDFVLSNCINSGIRQIAVLTQYKAQSLIRHITLGWNFFNAEFDEFIEVLPAQQRNQEGWYSGTANAVYQNLDILQNLQAKHILILAGDHIYKMDYASLLNSHIYTESELTIATIGVPVSESDRYGIMETGERNRITAFTEKPSPGDLKTKPGQTHVQASMGIYVFNTQLLIDWLVQDAQNPGSDHDFGKDIIPAMIERHKVTAWPFVDGNGKPMYWKDAGTIDSYWAASMDLVSVVPELNLYDKKWPVYSRMIQVPPAKFVFNDDGRRGMAVDSIVAHGSIVSGSLVENSLLSTNVRVSDYSHITRSVLLPDVVIGQHCRIDRAIIDKKTVIPDGTVIGFNRKSDAELYHVSPGGIALVTPEMLGQDFYRMPHLSDTFRETPVSR
jgi:glucose-1-phosphate adenylyltransferase